MPIYEDPSTLHRNIHHIRPNVTSLVSLLLKEFRLEKMERSFPINIRLEPCNARILHHDFDPSICDSHHPHLALLDHHRRRRQLQEQHTRFRVSSFRPR